MYLTASIIKPSELPTAEIGTENRAPLCCASMPGIDGGGFSSTSAGCETLPQNSGGRVAGLIGLSGSRFPCNGAVGRRTHKELTPPGVGIGSDDPAKSA